MNCSQLQKFLSIYRVQLRFRVLICFKNLYLRVLIHLHHFHHPVFHYERVMDPGKLIQEMMIVLAMTSDLINLFHHIIILDITFFIQILSSNKRWPWWKCLYNILKLFPHWFVFFIILSNTFISNLFSSISWTWPYGILCSSRTPQFIPNNPLHHFTH